MITFLSVLTEIKKQQQNIFTGDILIFMPGQEDIEVTCELVAGKLNENCSLLFYLVWIDDFFLSSYQGVSESCKESRIDMFDMAI